MMVYGARGKSAKTNENTTEKPFLALLATIVTYNLVHKLICHCMQTPAGNKGIHMKSQRTKAIRIKFVAGKFWWRGKHSTYATRLFDRQKTDNNFKSIRHFRWRLQSKQNEVISAYITLLCMSNYKLRCA